MNKSMRLFLIVKVMAIFSLCLTFLPSPLQADTIVSMLDFGIDVPTSGTISYVKGVNPFKGANIQVDYLTGTDTPLDSGVTLQIFGGVLNFETGKFIESDNYIWVFGSGGNIEIKGGVDLNANGILDGGDIPLNTILLSGIFTEAMVARLITSDYKFSGASFSDTIDSTLAAFYGLAESPFDGNFSLNFNAKSTPPNGFSTSKIFDGSVSNSIEVLMVSLNDSQGPTPVPEPATILQFGFGLIGLFVFWKKRLLS